MQPITVIANYIHVTFHHTNKHTFQFVSSRLLKSGPEGEELEGYGGDDELRATPSQHHQLDHRCAVAAP